MSWFGETLGKAWHGLLTNVWQDRSFSVAVSADCSSHFASDALGEHEDNRVGTCLAWDGSHWVVERSSQPIAVCRKREASCSMDASPDQRSHASKRLRITEGAKNKAIELDQDIMAVSPLRRQSVSTSSLRRNILQKTCSICCEPCLRGTSVQLSCGHGWYCTTCMLRHVEARLDLGNVQISCPECPSFVNEADLRRLLPSAVMDRLLSQSLERAVSMESDLHACPTPDCAMRVALDEESTEPCLNCELCGRWSCVLCGAQPYHMGFTCEEHARRGGKGTDDDLMQWVRMTGSKQCPKCKVVITKENLVKQGTQYVECHKMMCRNCNTKFCFKCLAILTHKYSCGCSDEGHGFINPKTGGRIKHIKVR